MQKYQISSRCRRTKVSIRDAKVSQRQTYQTYKVPKMQTYQNVPKFPKDADVPGCPEDANIATFPKDARAPRFPLEMQTYQGIPHMQIAKVSHRDANVPKFPTKANVPRFPKIITYKVSRRSKCNKVSRRCKRSKASQHCKGTKLEQMIQTYQAFPKMQMSQVVSHTLGKDAQVPRFPKDANLARLLSKMQTYQGFPKMQRHKAPQRCKGVPLRCNCYMLTHCSAKCCPFQAMASVGYGYASLATSCF